MYNKDSGRYLPIGGLGVARPDAACRATRLSISRSVTLRLYFPRVKDAKLVKAHVVKEQRATFSAAPETERCVPPAEDVDSESVSGRRLDPHRLARDDGRSGPAAAYPPRSGGSGQGVGPPDDVSAARRRVV